MFKIDADQADQRLKVALYAQSAPTLLLVYKANIEFMVQGSNCLEQMEDFESSLDELQIRHNEELLAD